MWALLLNWVQTAQVAVELTQREWYHVPLALQVM